ncbi:hypothetical protein HH310_28815 [Actinoplanes sp. TBRC 11911]|uniref:hypothetical protein n=1 Tax=Actinoplanes sp. TBRC 11911 TaxID=2729386 RepID=UPI00145D3BB9|nr:hypothetical protein [Actinoplanes sp. TBRC 11911]NMO55174.1 hypothetical protein [Actinoplanes sp. TBRC 11911]
MSTVVQPAYPYVNVTIDTSGLLPAATRNPGVVAVVGNAAAGVSAPAATPVEVTDHASVLDAFANGGAANPLTQSLDLVFQQDPRPSKVYGVRTDTADAYAAALAGLDAADDVTWVCLAGETKAGKATSGNTAATGLMALKEHVENASAGGSDRIAVAMVDPTVARSPKYVSDILAASGYGPLRSDDGRMVLVTARGATGDAAAAVMGTVAGYPPGTSVLLKQVRGFTMPITSQYTPPEITALAGEGIIPLIDPALIPGTGLFLADGGVFTSDATRNYLDIVTLLDQMKFNLRAGLIGAVGDSRITKAGLTAVKIRVENILAPFAGAGTIDSFSVTIPLLAILGLPEPARTDADTAAVVTARQKRQVEATVLVEIAATIHQLNVTLVPHF